MTQKDEIHIESNEFQEFFPDSSLRYFRFGENIPFSEAKYWLNNNLLYEGYFVDKEFIGYAYKYELFDKKSKLKLTPDYNETTILIFAPIPTTIYQRIK